MADSKAGKATASTTKTGTANGAVLFQKMAADFVIPTISRGGQWDTAVNQLCAKENKGATVKLYETDHENVQLTYTRAKALKNAAKRLGKEILVAVRIIDGKSCLLAQAK